ncbi:MAG: DUF2330 domain-containing protein [Myxococcota bacterium]
MREPSKNKAIATAVLAGSVALVAGPRLAAACGGCFVPPEENTQVTGHRMVLSVSAGQTTLYDQIEYAGNPEDFAWVLPTRGLVDVGVSSDLIFNQLGFDTTVSVSPPPLDCDWSLCRNEGSNFAVGPGTTSGAGGASPSGGVDVIASEVVGPFETVQLQASDPAALDQWLDSHGYNIPADIDPIIADYVNNGFGFLAMKLVPGVGIDKMAPVRITTPGASPTLPLKMVAAGTGATTTMTLYVVGEGRYEPANFPSFTIEASDLVWDWDQNQSNYRQLRQAAYDESSGFAWLVESSVDYSVMGFRNNVLNVIDFVGPADSGYGEDPTDVEGAREAAEADLDVLFAGLNPSAVKVTRLRAELSRPALANDLALTASADQTSLPTSLQTTEATGTWPECPCGGGSSDPSVPKPSRNGGSLVTSSSGSSCTVEGPLGRSSGGGPGGAVGGLGLLGALGFWAHRRRRRSTPASSS